MDDIFAKISMFAGAPDEPKVEPKGEKELPGMGKGTNSVLVFSKDRPFQLDQFLKSLHENVSILPDKIVVLYTAGTWQTQYDEVRVRYSNCKFVLEEDFSSDLMRILHSLKADGADGGKREGEGEENAVCVTFCVDDLLFTANTDLRYYAKMLTGSCGKGCFSVQIKLHPGISYSHPASKVCLPPPLTAVRAEMSEVSEVSENSTHSTGSGAVGKSEPHCSPLETTQTTSNSNSKWQSNDSNVSEGSKESKELLLRFSLFHGTVDWRYPFDLCGSMYRLSHVLALLSADKVSKEKYANPNLLETCGNREYWSSNSRDQGLDLSQRFKHCLCPSTPHLRVLTVNRVQETYEVPVYQSAGGEVNQLNRLTTHTQLDFSAYHYNPRTTSVHVGGLHFLDAEPGPASLNLPLPPPLSPSSTFNVSASTSASVVASTSTDTSIAASVSTAVTKSKGPKVTVILPVYNAEDTLEEALLSMLRYPHEQGCSEPFEVLVVDDGSTDRSLAIAQRIAEEITMKVSFVTMTILALPQNVGLSRALDAGVAACRTELIARMDADDVMLPGRLGRQATFLDHNPGISVVGGQALLLQEQETGESKSNSNYNSSGSGNVDGNSKSSNSISENSVARGIPVHPALVQWEMLFRCCVLHPTVMIRKSALLQAGGYFCPRKSVFTRTHQSESKSKLEDGEFGGDGDSDSDSDSKGKGKRDDEGNSEGDSEGFREGKGNRIRDSPVEDYDLWGRLMQQKAWTVANIPDVVLSLRVHIGSKSQREAKIAKEASLYVRQEMIKYWLPGKVISNDVVRALGNPGKAELDQKQLQVAVEVLEALEKEVLEGYTVHCATTRGGKLTKLET